MGPRGSTKGNAQLTRKNDISFTFTLFKLVYCLARESLKCNSLVYKFCMFLQKETSHCQNTLALDPQGPKHYVFGDPFYSKNARKLKFHVFLLFVLENICYHHFTWSGPISQEIVSFFPFVGLRTKLEQIHNFLRIRYTSGKMVIYFLVLKWRNTWNLRFLCKTGRQKCSSWVLADPFYAYEG